MESYTIDPVGIVRSPFQEKFGTPRQSGLLKIQSRIDILPPFNLAEAFSGLDEFSHIWVSFVFHQAVREAWKPTVRPPRLGGNEKKGVFASRAPFRPNSLGLSVVKLQQITFLENSVQLHVSGLDVIDQTPVVDIKPYIPYADCVPDAVGGFAVNAPKAEMSVEFSEQASEQLNSITDTGLRQQIVDVLSYDVRPAYKKDEESAEYGMRFSGFNIRWQVCGRVVQVTSITDTFDSDPA